MFKPRNFTEIENDEEEEIVNLLEQNDMFKELEKVEDLEIKAVKKNDIKETTINEDVTIEGNIFSRGNLNMFGNLTGNLTCDYDLVVSGVINGNIKCGSLAMKESRINGDVEVANEFNCPDNSFINGNLSAKECVIDGEIKGQITCQGNVHIQKNANIVGDITCGTISILQGSNIDGRLIMKK